MVHKTTESGWNCEKAHAYLLLKQRRNCGARKRFIWGSQRSPYRQPRVGSPTDTSGRNYGKTPSPHSCKFQILQHNTGSEKCIDYINIIHFELHCWWHASVNNVFSDGQVVTLELLLLRQLAYHVRHVADSPTKATVLCCPYLWDRVSGLIFYSDTAKDVITKYRIICWSCRSGLSNVRPLVTWIVSVIQFSKCNIIGLQNITLHLY
jgi:hypothetical protein